MLAKSDERKRVIIFLMCSTGVRIGAIKWIRKRNLEKIGKQYQITVYERTKDQYVTFCTPEAAHAIDEYLEYRTRSGETLNPDSPLIREQFQPHDQLRINKPIALSEYTLHHLLERVAVDAGVRVRSTEKHKRKEVMLSHGFRKFFNTCMVNAGVNPIAKELMLGHYVHLDTSYFRPTQEQMFQEYKKAEDALTINEEFRLKKTIAEKDEHIKKVESEVMIELADVRKEQKQWRDLMADNPELMMQVFEAMRKRQLGKI
jgi:integrase